MEDISARIGEILSSPEQMQNLQKLASMLGVVLCVLSLLMVAYIVVKTLLFGDPVSGWPSLACMVMFVGGMQLFCTGILGQYLAKTYLEVKGRPIYLLRDSGGGDGHEGEA